MMEFWDRMSDLKGAAWVNQYGNTDSGAFKTWCLLLKDLSAAQIEAGFIRYLESGGRFLDGPKFRDFCLGKSDHNKAQEINWQAYKPFKQVMIEHDERKAEYQKISGFMRDKIMPMIRERIAQGLTKEQYQDALDHIGTWDSRFANLVVLGEKGDFKVKNQYRNTL